MLMAGGRIEYEGNSHCNTFAPEDLATFYKQRRRWGPSTTANIWQLLEAPHILKLLQLNKGQIQSSNQYHTIAIFYDLARE